MKEEAINVQRQEVSGEITIFSAEFYHELKSPL